jgi:hypothetical protein
MDLRRAVPETLPPQYLDLEAVHVHGSGSSDISSGDSSDSNSDVDSHSSFIDDTPTGLSAADVVYVKTLCLEQTMPLTAGRLLLQTVPFATDTGIKRRRIIIQTSSSSSSPPHPNDDTPTEQRTAVVPVFIDVSSSPSTSPPQPM